MRRLLVATVMTATLAASSARATTINVPGDQPTIQAGIDASSAGDTVLVASGTYTGAGNRDLDAGGRDLVILSEEGSAATVIDCQGSDADPHRGFFVVGAGSTALTIEGFTVRNGYASEKGGGIYCESTALTLVDCVIEDCEAGTSFNDLYGFGGGLYCLESTLLVDECAFLSCEGGWPEQGTDGGGGGAEIVDCSGSFSECEFGNNRSSYYGGGLAISSASSLTLTACTFQGNTAGSLGGGWGLGGGLQGDASLEDVEFIGNSANAGGGMHGSGVLTRVLFHGNGAGFGGGGLYGGGLITDAIFIENHALYHDGGGVYGGGVFERVAFIRNSAEFDGGAVLCWGSSEFRSCTFVGNYAGLDGAATACSGTPVFDRVVIAFNGSHVPAVACGNPEFECSDIYGNPGGDWVDCIADQFGINGNISADPMFCDAPADDYSVDVSSPCLPHNNSCGELIGALGQGCGAVGIYVSPDGTGEAPTLQAAIDSCLAGGAVVAGPGVFSGDGNQNLDFHGKPIRVVSAVGAASTRIDCQGSGRGVFFHSGEDTLSVLEGFTISNAAADTGAGILCDGSSPRIKDCIIELCTATSGAGVACLNGSAPEIVGTALAQNIAGLGAGLHCRSGSSPRFTDSSVTGNWAGEGGGVWVSESVPVFTDALIDSNMATNGGGVFCTVNGNITLERCSVVGNTAFGSGGGMFCTSSSPLVENVTFFANSTDGVGAGIHSQDSSPILRGALVAFNLGGSGIECAGAPQPLLEYSDVFGNAGGDSLCGLDLGGNISEDPLFCDIWDGDFTLCTNSPCLVAGAPSGWIGRHGVGCSDCGGTGLADAPGQPGSWSAPWISATPSPFSGRTSISYQAPRASNWITLSIYSVSGRKVTTLVDAPAASAPRTIQWDGRDGGGHSVASGVYLCKLDAGDQTLEKKITLLR